MAAQQFWQEVTSQSWRTELDYGLVSGADAAIAALHEQLLVVAANHRAVKCLLQAVAAAGVVSIGSKSRSDVVVVQFEGWNLGQTQQQLASFKQLNPQLVQQLKTARQ